jgi:hypothetical protein
MSQSFRDINPFDMKWRIELEGRAWDGDEAWSRYDLTPEKLEMIEGKLLWSDEHRLRLLGLLLENCGLRAAVHLGDPELWRAAVAELDNPMREFEFTARLMHRLWDLMDEVGPERASAFYEEWMTDDFVGVGLNGDRRNKAECIAAVAPGSDSRRWITVDSVMESCEEGSETMTALVHRTRHERQLMNGSDSSSIERWRQIWRHSASDSGWRVVRHELLSVELITEGVEQRSQEYKEK